MRREDLGHESDVRLLFTKHNRVAVQRPNCSSMNRLPDRDTVKALNLRWPDQPAFLTVCTTFGCLPDHDCRFTWLRIDFTLGSNLVDEDTKPIACRLYPESSEDETKEIKSFEVSHQLGFKILDISTPSLAALANKVQNTKATVIELPRFGKMGAHPTWDFRTTEVHPEIAGDFSLILVAALPANTDAVGEITLSAEVQIRSSLPKFPLLMKRTYTGAAKNSFKLRAGEAI